jgi:sec-independent protein translocase protein TatA
MFGLGVHELIIVGIVAVLLFGKRLPEVARSLGKSYQEFRRGLHDIQSSVSHTDYSTNYGSSSSSSRTSSPNNEDNYDEPTAPKFVPPPVEPQPEAAPGEPAE